MGRRIARAKRRHCRPGAHIGPIAIDGDFTTFVGQGVWGACERCGHTVRIRERRPR